MSIFGFTDIKDMFDGGGAGKPGSTYSTEGSIFDSDGENNYVDPNPSSGGSNSNTTGSAPQSGGVMSMLNPVSIIGNIAGWANNLNPDEDQTTNINGRQYYTNADGFTYTYNAIGLPYEVVQNDQGNFVDKLSVVDPETGLTGYQKLSQDLKGSSQAHLDQKKKLDKIIQTEGEGDDHHYIKVPRRDFKKAEAIIAQNIDGDFVKMDYVDNDGAGNAIIYFDFKSDDIISGEADSFMYDAVMDLEAHGIRLSDHKS